MPPKEPPKPPKKPSKLPPTKLPEPLPESPPDPLAAGWDDIAVPLEPIGIADDDFEFPELDAVLAENVTESIDSDTGADLPRAGAVTTPAGHDAQMEAHAEPETPPLPPEWMSEPPEAVVKPVVAGKPKAGATAKPLPDSVAMPEPVVAMPEPVVAKPEPVAKPLPDSVSRPLPEAIAKPLPPPEPELEPEPEPEPEPIVLAEPEPTGAPTADVGSVLDDRAGFTAETQRLAREREWQSLAALTSAALDHSPWARQNETRLALLVDLARLYRDRLRDIPSAEDTFRRVLELAPADPEPNRFLADRYRERGDWRALYDLRLAALDATWNPEQRLEWTREAARIAQNELKAEELAIAAWERLWRSGDAPEEARRALSESYRRAGEWDRLGEFLERRADEQTGAERVVAWREAVESFLTGDRNHDRATAVLARILDGAPGDPVALLGMARVHARRHDWAALAELGTRTADAASAAALLDVRRLAADALWTAGEHERSIRVYDCILAGDPLDADALAAKEEHLVRKGDHDGLVTLYDARAQNTEDPQARAQLLERAADLAARELGDLRRAAGLLERRATIENGRADALDRLAELYGALNEHTEVRRALEERLVLVRNPRDRIELLRRIGEHCAHRVGDDARAEQCWREILDHVPDDRTVREELIALYRRRGDFEAVDRAWSAFAWRPLDEDSLTGVWRAAAVNLQENGIDAGRTLRAWQRVLDLQPDELTALVAGVTQARALGERLPLTDALEAKSRVVAPAEAIELWLEMARLYEQAEETHAALATYERILRADARHAAALEAVARLYGAAHAAVTRGALEVAVAHSEPTARAATVKRMVALAGADALDRFFTLRRLLGLTGPNPTLLGDLEAAGTEAGAFGALVAVHEELAAGATSADARAAHHEALATLLETRLNDPVRALLTLASARQRVPGKLEELTPLLRLCETTGRHEDAFALLGVAAAAEAPAELRRSAIRLRQKLAEDRLRDPARAFYQAAWLVRLDTEDRQALADAERLAAAAKLWRELDGLYTELWDRAATTAERLALAQKRRELRLGGLADEAGALALTLVLYRLEPTRPLEEELGRRADALNAWDAVLPVIEGRLRQPGAAQASELAWLGATLEQKRPDARHAFTVYGHAFVADPSMGEIEARLTTLMPLGEQVRLGHWLREAAARAAHPMRAIELYNRVAALYSAAGREDLALDVHRRILQLDARAAASYEVACAHLAHVGLWRELRDLIEQRLENDDSADRTLRTARRLEIARISREHLRDGEAALRSYAAILEAEPDHDEALAGVRALTDGPMDPVLELERLRLELLRAAGAHRVELLLRCATLQERELDDRPGAIASLQKLVAESGAGGAGYEPLLGLYERVGAHHEVIDLMEARAAVLTDPRARAELLRAAIAMATRHGAAPERIDQLNGALLALEPDDRRARARLFHAQRRAGRADALAPLLADGLARLGEEASEERRLLSAERVRVLDRALGKSDEAAALVAAELERTPEDEPLLLWQAGRQLASGDYAAYVATRQRQVRLLPARLGALVLCHLAELAYEHDKLDEALSCYRAARTLDADNRLAAEGLKALGRRTRNWRSAAALLPDEGAQALPASERAARLIEHGQAAEASPAKAGGISATEWYERAIAVDPDAVAAWDALGRVRAAGGDHGGAYAAARAALRALWRTTPPDPRTLADEARRFDALAALATADNEPAATWYAERAHDIVPSLPTSALLVAQRAQADGRTAEATAILSMVVDARTQLPAAQRIDALYRFGVLSARSGQLDRALGLFRDGLRLEPLHPGLLHAVADVLAQRKRVAAAIQHYTQALLLATDARRRAQLYARIGTLWDEQLRAPDEAGACYDLAVTHGTDDSEVMLRALAYYRRTGRQERAARMIDRLLPRATTPATLAALWTERASLLATVDDAHAVEAFDMALSYDPNCRPAVEGLAQLLERRGEWEQLTELLEARSESGSAAERAASLRRLARIAKGQQHDDEAAAQHLERALALDPQASDYDQLLALIGDNEARRRERAQLEAARLALAGPFVPALTAAGLKLAADNQRRRAWLLLSALTTTLIQDQQLKSTVLELRKELEKQDTLPLLTPGLHRGLLPAEVPPELLDVLAELDERLPLGPATLEAIGAARTSRVDVKTPLGKAFAAIAERLGLEGALLTRADELNAPYRVLDDRVPHIVVKSELFGLLAPSETHALLAMVLEQARPGVRALASLAPAEAARLMSALLGALGGDTPADAAALQERIVAAAGPALVAQWTEQLGDQRRRLEPTRVVPAVLEASRRVALVAAGELRFAAKLLSRLDEGQPKMPMTGSADELEQFFAQAPAARRMLAFAASPALEGLL